MNLARSLLFVPGDRPDRFAKALASGADLVVIDLEDAVSPNGKCAARDAVHVALTTASDARAAVRLNGTQTPWHTDDLRAMAELPGLAAVMLPKAEGADDVASAAALGVPVIGLIETARGALALAALCAAPGLTRLAFGTLDFQVDSGIDGEGAELDGVRTLLVLHSRAARLGSPVDGIMVDMTDTAGLAEASTRSARLGFGGKLCVHPAQVPVINAEFLPTAEAVNWAHRILATIENKAVGIMDGKLVDKPVIDRAKAILRSYAVR